jgi:hypothetical protein
MVDHSLVKEIVGVEEVAEKALSDRHSYLAAGRA